MDKPKKGVGRSSKYKPESMLNLVESYAMDGYSDKQITCCIFQRYLKIGLYEKTLLTRLEVPYECCGLLRCHLWI